MLRRAVFHLIYKHSSNILMFKISFVFSLLIISVFEKFRETTGKEQIARLHDLNRKRVVFTSACLRTRRSGARLDQRIGCFFG